MSRVSHTASRAASRRLARAVFLLDCAGRQISAASNASSDRYHRNKLHNLAIGLRDLTLPLYRIVSHLERGGGQ